MERIMTIKQVSAKIDIRLNKGASADYDNLWPYIKQEAFQKAINDWVRRQVQGKNQLQAGDEETSMKVDDLQALLKRDNLGAKDKGIYSQVNLPTDYLYYKRLTPVVQKNNCGNVEIKSYFKEEANVDDLKHIPSFKFEETFHTIINNKAHIYHNKDFEIEKVIFTYYRKPKIYDFKKLDTVVEFNDSVCDVLVDEACKIIASDIGDLNQKALAQERAETNT
jgi:hypothetical protein